MPTLPWYARSDHTTPADALRAAQVRGGVNDGAVRFPPLSPVPAEEALAADDPVHGRLIREASGRVRPDLLPDVARLVEVDPLADDETLRRAVTETVQRYPQIRTAAENFRMTNGRGA